MPCYITTLPFDADCAFGARVCRSLEGAFVLGIFNCHFHVHCHLKEITQRGRLTLTSHFSIFNHFTIALWLEQQKEILPTIYFVFVLFFYFNHNTHWIHVHSVLCGTITHPKTCWSKSGHTEVLTRSSQFQSQKKGGKTTESQMMVVPECILWR